MVDLSSRIADAPRVPSRAPTAAASVDANSPSRPSHARLKHMPGLDGLRGAAVAAVVFFHDAPLWNGDRDGRLVGGYLGVDLFFTLSGFLITSLLLAEWTGTGAISLKTFWSRRARRLLPAVLVVLAAMGLFAVWFAPDSQLEVIRKDGLYALFYVANWNAIFSGGGYALGGTPSPLEHMWSLAVEEQFYVVWPLLVFVLLHLGRRRVQARRDGAHGAHGALGDLDAGGPSAPAPARPGAGFAVLAVCTTVGMVASAAYMVLRHHDVTDVNRVYLGSDTRASSILIGAVLAIWVAWRGPVASRAGRTVLEVAAALALAGLVFAWVTVEYPTPGLFEGGLLLCGVLAAIVIAAVAHPVQGPVSKVLATPALRYLGLISYGLYLWHWPVFVVLNPDRTGWSGWQLSLVRYAVSMGIAMASYYLLEQPIRKGRWIHGWQTVAAPVAAVAVVIAALVVSTDGATADNLAGPSIPTVPTVAPGTPTGPTPGAPTPGTGTGTPSSGATGPGVTAPSTDTTDTADTTGATGATRPDPSLLAGPPESDGRYRITIVGDSLGVSTFLGFETILDEHGGLWVDNQAASGCGLSRADGDVRILGAGSDTGCHGWEERYTAAVAWAQPQLVVFQFGGWDIAERKLDGEWVRPCQPVFDDWFAGEVDDALGVLGAGGATVAVMTVAYVREPRSDLYGVDADEVDERVDCLNRIYRAAVERHADDGAVLVDLAAWVCPGEGSGEDPDNLDDGCKKNVALPIADDDGGVTFEDVRLRPDGLHYEQDGNGEGKTIVARWIIDTLTDEQIIPALTS